MCDGSNISGTQLSNSFFLKETVSAFKLLLSVILFQPFNDLNFSVEAEFAKLKLGDLSIVTTLGVGGFGRVELVSDVLTSEINCL